MKVSESRAICYDAGRPGGSVVTRSGSIWLGRVALAGALAAALALAGCGRKGGLDEPPMAAATDQPPPPGQPATYTPDGKPNPPVAAKRRTFLDWLID
jgi:predicted small lipoprotein YifL